MLRLSIVGSPGAGKTTLSRTISERLGLSWVELDRLHHMPNWVPRERDAFRLDLQQHLDAAPRGWVVDGNYNSKVQDLVWEQADTVIWLDLPRRTVLPAVLGRTLYRGSLRMELWNGNREHLRSLLRTRAEDNLMLWTATRFAKYRARYLAAMLDPRWEHLRFLRLRSRAEVAAWLETLEPAP